jgi:His/Glu/Gln/Arg/opine family amino acid ABC transporter permease subunit
MGYEFDWTLPLRRPYIEWLAAGLAITALLTVVSTVASLLVGVVASVCRLSQIRLLRAASLIFVEVFRGIPTLFWILFFCFVMPTLMGHRTSLLLNAWPALPLAAALTALITSNGAHVAEIVRSGIQALPQTQRTAGLSLGLSRTRVWISIILPQALRVSLPALGPRMVHNFHNTSLALVVSVPELTWQSQQIETTTFRGFEAMTIVSLIYVVLSLLMTLAYRMLERHTMRWA